MLSLLHNLNGSTLHVKEVIIVDGGGDRVTKDDVLIFKHLEIRILYSPLPSVCIQRNMGIRAALSSWIFLCDDDMEVPGDYLIKIEEYCMAHPEAEAISGLVLQQTENSWRSSYPVESSKELFLKYIFGMGIWGEIKCPSGNYLIRRIQAYYRKKGNHIAPSGWPVITDLSESCFTVPVFGLGASVIHKKLLLKAPYDESLDRHGIGDHYGVAADFSPALIHVLKNAWVYHHHEPANRLQQPLQYYRRTLALDYFVQVKKQLSFVKRRRLLWSLLGNMMLYLAQGDRLMCRAAWKSLWRITLNKNPYLQHIERPGKPVDPML